MIYRYIKLTHNIGEYYLDVKDGVTEVWNFNSPIESGEFYNYEYDVKIEDSQTGFSFKPYVMNTATLERIYIPEMDVFSDSDWVHVSGLFKALTQSDGGNTIRFGFIPNGAGNVCLDNITLKKVVASEYTEPADISSDEETLLPEDSTLAKEAVVVVNTGEQLKAEIPDIKAKNQYVLKFAAFCTDSTEIEAFLGSSGFSNFKISKDDGCVLVKAIITAEASGNIELSINNIGSAAVYKNIELYRQYAYGDVNGDDLVDIKDLIRYKKYMSGSSKLVTYIYADVCKDNILDSGDMAALRKILMFA